MARVTQTRMGTKGKRYPRRGRYKYRSGSLYRSRGARWTPNGAAGSMPALSVNRGVRGFPTEIRTTLRYSDVISLTSTGNAVTNHVFRMNSLFDPDFTATGHQPYYFDQFATIYQRYCVIGSKLTATFTPIPQAINGTATTQLDGPVICAVWGDPTSTNTTTLSTIMETNTSMSGQLSTATGGHNQLVLSTTYSPETKLGLSNADDTVGSSTTGSPSQVWYGIISLVDTGLAAATAVSIKVDMEFRVRFFQQIDISGS